MTSKEIKIKLMNEIINAAINYGGDPGGPYLTEEYWDKLWNAVDSWLRFEGISVRDHELVQRDGTSDNRWCEIRKKVQ